MGMLRRNEARRYKRAAAHPMRTALNASFSVCADVYVDRVFDGTSSSFVTILCRNGRSTDPPRLLWSASLSNNRPPTRYAVVVESTACVFLFRVLVLSSSHHPTRLDGTVFVASRLVGWCELGISRNLLRLFISRCLSCRRCQGSKAGNVLKNNCFKTLVVVKFSLAGLCSLRCSIISTAISF